MGLITKTIIIVIIAIAILGISIGLSRDRVEKCVDECVDECLLLYSHNNSQACRNLCWEEAFCFYGYYISS